MMASVVLVGCLLAHSTFSNAAERSIIRSIRFDGNRAIGELDFINVMILKSGFALSLQQLIRDTQSLLNLYRQSGYYFADVHVDALEYSDDSTFVDVPIGVSEGEQVSIGEIRVEGNSGLSDADILLAFDTRAGGILDPPVLEKDIDNLLSRYERIGYPYAKVEVSDISTNRERSPTSLHIQLRVDEGSKVQINEIRVAGNKETKENVILRETRLRVGETFDYEKIKKIQQRLNRLNIFSTVAEPELYMTQSGGGLRIDVREGNTNTFDGVVGYVPAGFSGQQGFLTGMVNVSMRNLFGTARKLNVRWQKDDRNSQEIALRYVEPWVLDYPVNLSGAFMQRQQDTIYVRRVVEGKADLLITESLSFGGLLTQETVIPSSTTAVQLVLSSRTLTTGLEIQYDTRDDVYSPTSGVNYRSDYQIGRKKFSGSFPRGVDGRESNSVHKFSVDAEFFAPTFANQVIAVGLHGRQLTSDHIELADLYRFGGTNSLRGYRENQFLGSRIAWTNAEYRFLSARRSYFYGFFDTGYYFAGDKTVGFSATKQLKYGYGVGMRIETSLVGVGVSFALGKGDSFGQAKIHFGLINEF